MGEEAGKLDQSYLDNAARILALRLDGIGGSLVNPRALLNGLCYKMLLEPLRAAANINGHTLHCFCDPLLTYMEGFREESRETCLQYKHLRKTLLNDRKESSYKSVYHTFSEIYDEGNEFQKNQTKLVIREVLHLS